MKNIIKTIAAVSIVALCAFSSPVMAKERYVFIEHSPDSDSWWNTIKNAINIAEKQFDVTVEFRNPPTGDIADMARLVEQATATNPDGIIVTIADYDALEGPITKAIAKGIPVITVNSGTHAESEKLGAMLHIGQPEYDAGLAGGKLAKAAGAKTFLCVNHFISSGASTDRCRGFADGLGTDLADQMIDSGTDPAEVKNKVLAYLSANPNTDAILTLGPASAAPTISALKENGMAGQIYFGTFDLSEEISDGIKGDIITWAIDQQPFLQGWLPVALLVNFNRYGLIVPHHINSGPGFITKDSIDKVSEMAGVYR